MWLGYNVEEVDADGLWKDFCAELYDNRDYWFVVDMISSLHALLASGSGSQQHWDLLTSMVETFASFQSREAQGWLEENGFTSMWELFERVFYDNNCNIGDFEYQYGYLFL